MSGLVLDPAASKVSPAAWTDLLNVSFRDGYVQKGPGSKEILIPAIVPYGLFPAPVEGIYYWMIAGKTKIHCFQGTTESDITRAASDYNAGNYDLWNSIVFNNIPILNNGVDAPQTWMTVDPGTPLVDLDQWPASTACKVMRAFKNYLVALDLAFPASYDRRMVKWSHPADPGTLPASWDHTDPTKDAGEQSLAEGRDALIDCLPLGDVNLIYGETSTWAMRLVGGEFIFDFHKIFDASGILSQSCVASILGKHFVVTQDDIILHNGSSIDSLVNARLRRWFFNQLNGSAYFLTKVIPLYKQQEVWICFPTVGAVIDKALVWNWGTNTWTIHDLPSVRAITSALYNPTYSVDLWDSENLLAWDDENSQAWGDAALSKFSESIMFSPADTTGILMLTESLYTRDGAAYQSMLERKDIAISKLGSDGQPFVDAGKVKQLNAVWPIIEAVASTVIVVTVGTQALAGGAVTWDAPVDFVVGTDEQVGTHVTGRYLAVKFDDPTGTVAWKMLGYFLDLEEVSVF